jgi:hypothetical protein
MVDERPRLAASEIEEELLAASAPTHFTEDTPTAVLVRQVLGAIAEFDKTTLVAKLAASRTRKRIATGRKVEGRKSHAEERPEVVALAKALRRRRPKGGQMSLRAISAELAAQDPSTSAASRSTRPRSRPCWRNGPEAHGSHRDLAGGLCRDLRHTAARQRGRRARGQRAGRAADLA